MNRTLWVLVYVASGTFFWVPSILMHAIRGYDYGSSRLDIIATTMLPLLAAEIALEIVSKKRMGSSYKGTIALWMLLGIWVYGPLCMTIGFSFSGGGFVAQLARWVTVVLGTAFFIPFTFILSTYDGTLGALLLITVWFIVAGILTFVQVQRRRRRQPAEPAPPTYGSETRRS